MLNIQIIICSPQLGLSNESNSGGEVYDREILLNFAKIGSKIEILLPKHRPFPQKINNFNVEFTAIKTIFPPYIFNFFVLPYLFKIFKRNKFQILRIHSPYFVGPAAVIFKLFHPEVKLVASYLHIEANNLIFEIINRLIIKKFDLIVTISNFTKDEIIKKYKINSKKILVTYPGVSEKFIPRKKNVNLIKKYKLKNKFVILYLGGLKFRKNPMFILDVLKKIKAQNVIFLIAGIGQAKSLLKFKAKTLKLEPKIRFLGFIPEENKLKIFNLADVFVLPSKKEGFGMIVTEAAACGVPAIVSDRSSLGEIVKDNETGYVLKLDSRNWAKKIDLLIGDHKLRNKLGQNAQKFVRRNFSWEKSAKIQLEEFQNLLI